MKQSPKTNLRILCGTAIIVGVAAQQVSGAPNARPDDGLAYSVNAWVASIKSGSPRRLAPGIHVVRRPIVVDAGETYQGCGRLTILQAGRELHNPDNPGAVFVSRDLVALNQAKASWSYEDVPMCPTICDLTIDGGGDVNDRPRQFQADAPKTCHGIRLYSGGVTLRNLMVFNVAGDAIRVWRFNSSRQGAERVFDVPENRIEAISVHKCFSGATFGGADGIVDSFTAGNIRDTALTIGGAAYSVRMAHCYGCQTGVEFGASGKNYGGEIVVENCGVGFVNRSAGSKVDFLRCFENVHADAILERKTRIVDCDITLSSENGVLVLGSDCWISGEITPRGGTGVYVRHQRARLTLAGFGRGTMVDLTDARARHSVVDIMAGGKGMTCVVGGQGKGNRIDIHAYAGAEKTKPEVIQAADDG